jgi:sarcosine oxidase subunit delta
VSFRLTCPNCGKRYVSEFAFRGEYQPRPSSDDPLEQWVDYVYMQENVRGPQVEWWYHRGGCRRWFLVKRDTARNTDHVSFWYEDRHEHL